MSSCLELGLARRCSVPEAGCRGVLQLLLPRRVPRESKAESMKMWDCDHRNKEQQLTEKKKNKWELSCPFKQLFSPNPARCISC